MKLSTKLLIAFLSVGTLPAAITGLLSLNKSSKALEQTAVSQLSSMRDIKKQQICSFFSQRQNDMNLLIETAAVMRKHGFDKLQAVQKIKKNQIEAYFTGRTNDISVLSSNETVSQALSAFSQAFTDDGGKVSGENWLKAEKQYAQWFNNYKKQYGYYDLFLITDTGDIVFTVCREPDFGQNLITGDLKNSSLGKCFAKASDKISIEDFAPYAPSNNEPAAFLSAPIIKDDKYLGQIAMQLSIDEINSIMNERTGLGDSGETYLVGSDKLMRSDSFLDPEKHTVKTSFANPATGSVDTIASREALAGKSNADVIIDYNGNPVLSVYSKLDTPGLNWAIIAEIDVAEAFCPKDQKGDSYYNKFTEQYNYYDLFLINPDGYCFFTVCHEADYQTNLLNGPYSNTSLGRAVENSLKTGQLSFGDFEPYAPSKNAPAAFIAQPIINNGKTEMIVALQLSDTAINSMMSVGTDKERKLEAYLTGQDGFMRSDSILAPEQYSIAASFANSHKNESEAIKCALDGNDDTREILSYHGGNVLSSWASIDIFGNRWALVCELDSKNAFAARTAITWMMYIVMSIAVASITILAWLITRSITKPINVVINDLRDSSAQITSAAEMVSSSSLSLAQDATQQAAGLEETSSSIEEISMMARSNADKSARANLLANTASQAIENGNEAVSKMKLSIETIQRSSEETAKVIKAINEIAFQTNLLALNAAVEAARAGESGKGFAVVAEEVRNLALRSSEAAGTTSAMLENAVSHARSGSQISSQVAMALEQIVSCLNNETDLIQEIALASSQQNQGVKHVNEAICQMDEATQNSSSNAEELASSAEQLNSQALQMNCIVSNLDKLICGNAKNTLYQKHQK